MNNVQNRIKFTVSQIISSSSSGLDIVYLKNVNKSIGGALLAAPEKALFPAVDKLFPCQSSKCVL